MREQDVSVTGLEYFHIEQVMTGPGGDWLQIEREQAWFTYQKQILCCEGGGALEQVAQRSCACPTPGMLKARLV